MLFSYSNEHSSASDGAILNALCDICDEIIYNYKECGLENIEEMIRHVSAN